MKTEKEREQEILNLLSKPKEKVFIPTDKLPEPEPDYVLSPQEIKEAKEAEEFYWKNYWAIKASEERGSIYV